MFVNSYISHDLYSKYSEKIFDLYTEKVLQEPKNQVAGYFNNIYGGLLNCKENIKKALKILENGKLGEYEIAKNHQYNILKKACQLDDLSDDEKNNLVKKVVGDSKETDADLTTKTC